jgi:hypothetical protein
MDAEHDATSASDALIFKATCPIIITRFGAIVSVEITGTSAIMVCDVTRHSSAGATTREDAAGGVSCTIVASVVGAVHFADPDEEILVKPGDIVHLQVTTAMGTAGDFLPYIQYRRLNWDKTGANANYNDATPASRMNDGTT